MPKKINRYGIDELPPIMRRIIQFKRIPGVEYINSYDEFFNDEEVIKSAEEYLAAPNGPSFKDNKYLSKIRGLAMTDPFFIIHIAMGNPHANDEKGFVNKMCLLAIKDLYRHYEGLCSLFLNVWAREHYKSSIMTRAIPLIHIFNNPTDTVLIQAANVRLAQTLMSPIRDILEMKEIVSAFDDILWANPKDSKKWTENELKINVDVARGENTFEISGLLEGQKIGRHYDIIISDDVETLDLARNSDQLAKLKEAYYYSLSMMAKKAFINVVGTYYSHLGLLVELRDKLWRDTKEYIYNYRKIPYRNKEGELVLFTSEKARIIEQDRASCRTQYELDPTPRIDAEFSSDDLIEVDPKNIPSNLFKLIIIDPAGNNTRHGDDWCMVCLGFRPYEKNPEDLDIFILDMDLMPMTETQARQSLSRIYMNNGLIQGVCYEHMAQGDYFGRDIIHTIKADCGITLMEDYTLIKLHPQGRGNKHTHIKRTLAVPFRQGRIYISTSIPYSVRQRFKDELDQFPVGRDDGMDSIAYHTMALDKLNFRYKKSSYFNNNVISIHKNDQNIMNHPLGWMAM